MKNIVNLLLLILISYLGHAQNVPLINAEIKGVILDKVSREPVVGASVTIRGTTNGAITDINGGFSLTTGQTLPFTLIVRSVGYKTLEFLAESKELTIELASSEASLREVVVTSRRRAEKIQEVPIPISIVRGVAIEDAGAFNVNRLKELVPTVQLYASNPPEHHL
ncbi:MAG: TonB-dependent receptor, partial [Leadbetterella sp.]|nr:TonB-dependent receptor [Leadbetterella sp.]